MKPARSDRPNATECRPNGDPMPTGALTAHLRGEAGFLRGQLADTQAAPDQRSRGLAAERERCDVLHREALVRIPALGAGPG